MEKHLVVFDDQCPFCQHWVMWILQKDPKKKFGFTGFNGQTVKQFMHLIDQTDFGHSVVFIEDFQTDPKVFLYGKAALRILWKMDGFWKVIGFLGFLPRKMVDPIYRMIAKKRAKTCKKAQDFSRELDRFLP